MSKAFNDIQFIKKVMHCHCFIELLIAYNFINLIKIYPCQELNEELGFKMLIRRH